MFFETGLGKYSFFEERIQTVHFCTESREIQKKKIFSRSPRPEGRFLLLRRGRPGTALYYLEGTKINYPVVQGTDSSYYLQHMFDGSWNGAGCIFLDSRNEGNFSDRHSIIYGHHIKTAQCFPG